MTAIATVKAVLYHRVWFGLIKLVTPMSDETFFINSLVKVLLFFIEIGTMEVRKILEESNGMDNRTSVQTV